MVDDFEYVTLVDGFPAAETEGEGMLGFLVLDVVQETLLAGAMPATGHRRLDHRFFGADGAFVSDLGLDLLKHMRTEFVRDVLLA